MDIKNALRYAGLCVCGNDAEYLYPHHRRYAAHGRRQHRPRHRQSSAARECFRAGAGKIAPVQAEKPKITDFKPYVGCKRRSTPAVLARSMITSSKAVIPQNDSTAKSMPAMSTPIPVRIG